MTRQRNRESLIQTIYTECPYCFGKGLVKNFESVSIEMERSISELIHCKEQFALEIVSHPEFDKHLNKGDKNHFIKLFEKNNAKITFKTNELLHISEYEIYNSTNGTLLEV